MSSTLHSLFLWHLYLSPRLFLTVRLKRWWAQWFGWNLFCQHQTIFNHFFNSFLSLKKALQPSQTKASKCFPLDWSPQIAHRGFMLTMDTITSHATLETRSMCISSFKDLSKVVHWIAKGRDHPTHERKGPGHHQHHGNWQKNKESNIVNEYFWKYGTKTHKSWPLQKFKTHLNPIEGNRIVGMPNCQWACRNWKIMRRTISCKYLYFSQLIILNIHLCQNRGVALAFSVLSFMF